MIVGTDFEPDVGSVDLLKLDGNRNLLPTDHLVCEESLLVLCTEHGSDFESVRIDNL
jgi:hypothetical protein